jgi:mono/diheme cytochrome c family protein
MPDAMKFSVALALAFAVGGCASMGDEPVQTGPSEFAKRGAEIALMRCAGCHAISLTATSPRSNAPPFRELRIRFNEITWERTMRAIAEGGHDEMPPVFVDDIDARDLRAYIESLR